VRVRYAREYWQDADAIGNILVMANTTPAMLAAPPPTTQSSVMSPQTSMQIPLRMVADIRFVEGPNAIKSENGRLRNYVMLNVRDRDIVGFVDEARQAIKPIEQKLAGSGMSIEWAGEFEHQVRARQTLAVKLHRALRALRAAVELEATDAA